MSRWAEAKERKLLERVRALCSVHPEVTERLSHGTPCFFLRDKHPFVMCWDNHHGDGRLALWCAAPGGAQTALVASDPDRFFIPPYVGTRGWIGVRIDGKPNWEHVAAVIDEAYHAIVDAHPRKPRRRS